jgi:hypothetical protein
MKRLSIAVLIAVVALLALGAMMAVAAPPTPGTAESFGAVQNTSGVLANVSIDYYDTAGAIKATRTVTVFPKATQGLSPRLLDGTAQALPPGWVGSAIVSSDQEVVAISYINWTGGSTALSPDGKTSADYNGISAPSPSILFPFISNADNEASTLVVQNAGTAAGPAFVTYYDRSGVKLASSTTASIPAGAQATVQVANAAGLPANLLGAAVVTSTNPLAGVGIGHWAVSFGSYGYDAEPTTGGTSTLYFPKVIRRAVDKLAAPADCGAHPGGWDASSGIVVQNTSTTAAAAVTLHFYDRLGNEITAALITDSIPAFSSHGYNTHYLGNAPAAQINALGCNFLGSVKVEATGATVVGILKDAWENEKWASAYNGVAGTVAGTSLYFPYFYHTTNNYATAPSPSNPWAQWTGVIVQNVDTTPLSVWVNILDRAGNTVISVKDPVQLAPGVAHGYNSQYDGSIPGSTFATLPWNFGGGAYITSTGKIVGAMTTWNMFGGDANETLGFSK